MATDPTPWFVGGGAEHSPEVARLLAYAATSGAEGIVEPSSLRVSAQSVPNGTVRALPGAALIRNRYAGGTQQTYALRNATSTDVAIPATGSSGGRTDLIVARVLDPQYEGQAPANPLTFQYARIERINGVPGGTKTAQELSLGYPAVALARVHLPPSTGTVTAGMITDLREVALPRFMDVRRPRPSVAASTELLIAAGVDGEYFPNGGGEQWVDIPEWATRVQISATWMSIRYEAGANFGEMWAEFGPYKRPSTREYSTQRYFWDTNSTGGTYRSNWIVEDDLYIPAALRGTNQCFVMKARHAVAGGAHKTSIDAMSGVCLSLRFLEVADPSSS